MAPDQHWFKDAQHVPIELTGGYWYENGEVFTELIHATKPIQEYSNEQFRLSVNATFLPDFGWWVIADLDPEVDDDTDQT